MMGFIPPAMAARPDMDAGSFSVTGDYEDRIFKHGRLVETREGHNLVVNSFLVLTACMLTNKSEYQGLQYWAVGSGASSWDDVPVDPALTETKLTNEIGRIQINPDDIVFLDENYEETTVPTNIIRITATFGPEDCNGKWREFGLFGANATSEVDSGIMADKKHHDLITKTEELTIERRLRLSIQFSTSV